MTTFRTNDPGATRRPLTGLLLAGLVLASLVLATTLACPAVATAQVVVLANGSPITELDIQQRMKLMETSTHQKTSREQTIRDLIDDRLKIAKAKSYGLEVTDQEVDTAFENMAKRQHITVEQFSQVLERAGIMPNTIKARVRAEITWNNLVRGRYSSTLQVGESDIANALRENNEKENPSVGYTYTLYPIIVVASRAEATSEAKRQLVENLRARFLNCKEGLPLARSLREVAIREPINRNSSDLPLALRDLLNNMEVGRLTAPEVTEQGIQLFALCGKKQSIEETPAKREAREKIYQKRFESESKKFLDEIRKQAMIEYK